AAHNLLSPIKLYPAWPACGDRGPYLVNTRGAMRQWQFAAKPIEYGLNYEVRMRLLLLPLNAARIFLEFVGGVALLIRDAALALRPALFGKRGRRLGWANLWAQMNRVGVQSI